MSLDDRTVHVHTQAKDANMFPLLSAHNYGNTVPFACRGVMPSISTDGAAGIKYQDTKHNIRNITGQ